MSKKDNIKENAMMFAKTIKIMKDKDKLKEIQDYLQNNRKEVDKWNI